MMFKQMDGWEATVRWGYRPAASLGRWTYEHAPGGGSFKAEIVSSDAFCLEQQPLVLSAPMGRATWTWHITSLQINGTTFTATVVNQEG
jgi:hypothetical protein